MKIYISIPITGHDELKQKIKAASIAERIISMGHEAVNPFDAPPAPTFNERERYSHYIGEDLKMLLGCDALLSSEPGCVISKGCRLEFQAAKIYGLQIYASLKDIPKD